MSDGVVIPLDVDDTRAKAKVARLKRDAGQAGKAFGQAGAQAARVGGAAGGALGRSLGGFSQGMGAGAIGLGLTGGGMLLSAFLQRDGERMTLAKDRESRIQARAADARSVMKSRDDLAAGGLNFLGAARRIISSGADKNRVRSAVSGGKSMGMGAAESLASMEAADATGVSMQDIQTGIATGQMGTDPMKVAQSIQKFNGLHNALAATMNVSPEAAGSMISRTLTDARRGNLARAGSAMSPVEQEMLDALLERGDTARVLESQAKDTLNPGAKLAATAAQKMMDSVNQLRAAADAQSTVGALLAEMGRVVGLSDGSASRQLAVGAAAASE
jgi:hypothetical protein